MKLKYLLPAAAALLLTACGTDPDLTDLAAKYPEQFRYCFGENAAFSLEKTEQYPDGSYLHTRRLSFTGADGAERAFSSEIMLDTFNEQMQPPASFTELCCLTQKAMQIPLMDKLAEDVLPPAIERTYRVSPLDVRLEGMTGIIGVQGMAYAEWADISCYAALSEADADRFGCTFDAKSADFQSVAQNPFFVLYVLAEGDGSLSAADTEEFCAQAEDMVQKYIALAGSPQNYVFRFRTAEPETHPDATELKFMSLLGEPYEGLIDDLMPALEQRLAEQYAS